MIRNQLVGHEHAPDAEPPAYLQLLDGGDRDPPGPVFELSPEELRNVPSMPGSLEEALNCLEDDHAFLLKGDVFTPDLIETYIAYKREVEVEGLRLRPHPYEFFLYYDV